MSKIVLKNIKSTEVRSTEDPFLYVGAIVRSNSGYLTPRIISTTSELDSIYGEFRWSQLYRLLISTGINVCLLPVTTSASKYNSCSLRICTKGNLIEYCYPKKGMKYIPRDLDVSIIEKMPEVNQRIGSGAGDNFKRWVTDEDNIKSIYNGTQSYGTILDISDSDIARLTEDTNWYASINVNLNDQSNNQCISNGYYSSQYNDPNNIMQGSYLVDYESNLNEIGFNGDTKGKILANFKNDWVRRFSDTSDKYTKDRNWGGLSTCLDILDFINEFHELYFKSIAVELDSGVILNIDEWIEEFISASYKFSNPLLNPKIQGEFIEGILKEYKCTVVYYAEFESELKKKYESKYKELVNTDKRYQRVLIISRFPKGNWFVHKAPFKLIDCTEYTEDILSKASEDYKLLEFYSKIKGEKGKDIKIKISRNSTYEELFDIVIENEIIQENYTVYTTDKLEDYIHLDAIHISDIGLKSELVEVVFYNYWYGPELKDGEVPNIETHQLIDSCYYDFISSEYKYYTSNNRDLSQFELPEGEFNLNRDFTEIYTYEDVCNTITMFKESDFYPDLFLFPDVERAPEGYKVTDFIDRIIDLVDDVTIDTAKSSQALLNLDYTQLSDEWISRLDSKGRYCYEGKNNRLLYFYGNPIIRGEQYPAFYPYINNILSQQYLEYPSQAMICNPFSFNTGNAFACYKGDNLEFNIIIHQLLSVDTDNGNYAIKFKYLSNLNLDEPKIGKIYLDSDNRLIFESEDLLGKNFEVKSLKQWCINQSVNYLKFDNLNYFYESIREPREQSSIFIIRYIASKYSRELMKVRTSLTGVHESICTKLINKAIGNCTSYLEYVDECTPVIVVDGNVVKVTLNITVPKLTNKTFYINITLNIK